MSVRAGCPWEGVKDGGIFVPTGEGGCMRVLVRMVVGAGGRLECCWEVD